MDDAHLSLDGSFKSLPLGLLWHLLSHLELSDLLRLSTTSKKALEITRNNDFWVFLYYRHLIPSPIYYDIGHAALIDPPTASWFYLYLEQLWAQYACLAYSNIAPMKFLHRTLDREVDAKWILVQPGLRAVIGPFDAVLPPFVYCYNTGFKPSNAESALEADEVTGCFNWSSHNFGDFGSLLPPLTTSPLAHEQKYTQETLRLVDRWMTHDTTGERALFVQRSPWFTHGAHGFVKSLVSSLVPFGSYSDFWRECSAQTARKLASKVNALALSSLESSDCSNLVESFNAVELTPSNQTRPISEDIMNAIFKMVKLGPPSLLSPLLDTPVRYFVCSNLVSSQFGMEHHHAVLLLALDRFFLLTWNLAVSEQDFESRSSEIADLIASTVKDCF